MKNTLGGLLRAIMGDGGAAGHMVGMRHNSAPLATPLHTDSLYIEQLRDDYDDRMFDVAAAEDPTAGEGLSKLELAALRSRALQAREDLISAAVLELGLPSTAAVIIQALVGDGGICDA